MQFDNTKYEFTDKGKVGNIALIIGVAGLVLSAVGFFVDRSQFMFSWLTSFTFWASVGFGGLFFVMIHHMTGAFWSVTARRLGENVMVTLPWMAIFVIPVFIGMSDLYEWVNLTKDDGSHHEAAQVEEPKVEHSEQHVEMMDDHAEHPEQAEHPASADHSEHMEHDAHAHQAHVDLVKSKAGYLNVPFFIIRTVIFFLAWSFLGFGLYRLSLKQDKPGFTENDRKKFMKFSAPGIIIFAFTVTFAGFDWLMSLFPAWYSTIYGLYYFSGGITAIMAFIIVVFVTLRNHGILEKEISVEHYHDLGKLLFAFNVVWAYFAFSQYLLIWYANIPEETIYFLNRWQGSWKIASLILPFGHFILPFVLLMSRHVKRNLNALRFWSIWLLVMHWLDLYWNIMPVLHPTSAMPSWIDLVTMMGIGGIFVFIFWRNFTSHPAMAFNDPKVQACLKFENM